MSGRLVGEILGRFDALGVRLSLDDAGRAASFAALRVLPLDELKIDVGFVHGLPLNSQSANHNSSVAPYMLVRLKSPACDTSALNFTRGSSLCPRIQLTI